MSQGSEDPPACSACAEVVGALSAPGGAISITALRAEEDAQACAHLMATSEPWVTLGRGQEASLRMVQDPAREVYVAREDGQLNGFIILCLTGAFVGYIQTICIHPDCLGARSWEPNTQQPMAHSPQPC